MLACCSKDVDARHKAAHDEGDDKSARESVAPNLPLAARLCVGHIGLNGAVAERLKAAVC